ncbi:alpha/beta hydrolase [Deinococcus rubellus]|uniref:Alpha/beta hydrolase n=1 Tax=Deinococcus rubellus TaxID=1889240 RepID=A0ABY5YGP5_9DEIO|nr:alpha/beta hydrolase [Deinococcus rubellus]UWX63973.1 alpha/beta hydrolase [Deinococcus rubellus]
MMTQGDLSLKGGRTLHFYDHFHGAGGLGRTDLLAVFWQHGTPNIGAPPAPLFAAAERLGLRLVGHDRPGYGGSSPLPGRDIASAAADVAGLADALGIARFAVMGHSGGGPHALACAALLPERVVGTISVAGLAPFGAPGLDWYAGMYPGGAAELRAAQAGREALATRLATDLFDPEMFTPADHAALSGDWAWLHSVVGPAAAAGPGPMIDDDLAYVAAWGFDPAQITCPVLLLHGGQDRIVPSSHSRWLAGQCASAELRLRPDDGHLSVLHGAETALEWLSA